MANVAIADERSIPIEVGQFSLSWSRYRKKRGGMIALVTLVLLAISVIVIPMLSPFDVNQANPISSYAKPMDVDALNGQPHIFGADQLGKDFFTRLFYGGRASLYVALIATAVTTVFGMLVGLAAGYFGKWADLVLMRFTDFMLALPLLPMYIFGVRIIVSATDTQQYLADSLGGIATTFLVFVTFGWMGIARLVRASVLSTRTLDYVEAARALGAGHRRIMFRHLLPNAMAPVLVAATFLVADFIIWESILSYFVEGIFDPPVPSWGNMLVGGIQYITRLVNLNPFDDIRAYLFIMPTFMIFLTVLCINYIGDTLREVLDPRGSGH